LNNHYRYFEDDSNIFENQTSDFFTRLANLPYSVFISIMVAFAVAVTLLSVLVSCEAFRPTGFIATKSMSLQSNLQPVTSSDNLKQSLKSLINLGVTGSAFLGLTAAALAADAAKAPVVSTPTTGPSAPVIDAEGFTVSDSGLKSKDIKVRH
jgi:uncharacterized membrane protein